MQIFPSTTTLKGSATDKRKKSFSLEKCTYATNGYCTRTTRPAWASTKCGKYFIAQPTPALSGCVFCFFFFLHLYLMNSKNQMYFFFLYTLKPPTNEKKINNLNFNIHPECDIYFVVFYFNFQSFFFCVLCIILSKF
jgi:hypothetical protein